MARDLPAGRELAGGEGEEDGVEEVVEAAVMEEAHYIHP